MITSCRLRRLGSGSPASTWPTIAFLTSDETARVFRELGDHKRNKAIFLVAYRHGLRTSEVGLLHRSDLDFKKLRVMLHHVLNSYINRPGTTQCIWIQCI